MSNSNVDIRHADMNDAMKQEVIRLALHAVDEFKLEKDVAAYIKHEFERIFGGLWHCIVGSSFGSLVSHESGHFIYFYVGPLAIMLFKAGGS